MTTLLLVLKVLGIVISGASVIGSKRLSEIEAKLRILLQWKHIKTAFDKVYPSRRFLSLRFGEGIIKILGIIVDVFGSSKERSKARLKGYFRYDPEQDKPKQEIDNKRQLRVREKLPAYALGIFFLLLLPIVLVLYIAIALVLIIAILLVELIFIILMILLLLLLIAIDFTIIILIQFLKSITWVISRPYVWLDLEVSKRGFESTIVVIGILIAIIAEIVSSYLQ